MRLVLLIILLSMPFVSHAQEDPVLFLPGIFGSRLYVEESSGSLEKVWDGFAAEKMRKLIMDEEGESIYSVRVGSIVDRFEAGYLRISDIYASFVNNFLCPFQFSGNVKPQFFASINIKDIPGNFEDSCEDVFVSYPYDWRHDVFDIIDNGTIYTSGEKVFLIDLVEQLAGESSSGSIDIVAHSNGGLLAKALLVRLEQIGKINLIDTVVLVGSPQIGTPKAAGAILHGYDQTTFAGLIKKADISRALSLNSPGAYGLLPSQEYIEENTPVAFFDDTPAVSNYRNKYGGSINSYQEFTDFLLGVRTQRKQPSESDMKEPAVLNKKILEKAARTHEVLDAWSSPEKIRFIEIVGVGNTTPISFSYSSKRVPTQLGTLSLLYKKLYKIKYEPIFTEYGDGEVVDSSAVGKGEKVHYFNFETLREVSQRDRTHLNFLIEKEIISSIEKILSGVEETSIFLTDERPNLNSAKNISLSVHSPVTLSVSDTQARVTSITYDTESDTFFVQEDIPGSRVRLVGESKYILLPDGEYSVEVVGLDVGSFDLVLSEINTDGSLSEINNLARIPTKEGSVGTAQISGVELGALSLDLDGDNSEDYSFSENSSNSSMIASSLKLELLDLPIRSELKSAITSYFSLWDESDSEDEKTNYIAQIKRIIRFLNGRYIEQDTADTWTALAEHLQ